MIGYHVNNRGRYKCDCCERPAYKTLGGIKLHLETNHAIEVLKLAEDEIERLKSIPPEVEIKERIVYRDSPKPAEKKKEYWYVRNYGIEGIYCTSCKRVETGVGIPVGQTIENTPHHCGNRTLLPVVEVR